MNGVIAATAINNVDFIVAEEAVIEVCPDHVFNINKVDAVDWLSARCRRRIKDRTVLAWAVYAAIGLVCTGRFNIKVNDNALIKASEVSGVNAFAAIKLICAVCDEGIVTKAANQSISAAIAVENIVILIASDRIVVL